MKILIIIQCTNLGGMEQSALLLLDDLQARGFQVEVLSLNPLGDLGTALSKRGISSSGIEYRGRGGWRSLLTLRKKLKRIQADAMIMIGHNLMAMMAIGNRWKEHRILSIHYHHQGVKPDWQWRLIYKVAVWRFKCVVFPSHFIMDEALEIAPFMKRSARLISIPFPSAEVPAPEERRAARARLGIPADVKVIGNAGWLIERKRWDVFLSIAARVVKWFPEAQFLIAGDGPLRAKLESQAKELGIYNQIRWLGWQKDLDDFYKSLDVMLFNSDWDAMGRTPIEAMCYGVPAVTSVVNGGLGEVIDKPSIGIFLPEHDIEALAGHVIRLLSDENAAKQLGMAGRARIAEIGSPERHTSRMIGALGL